MKATATFATQSKKESSAPSKKQKAAAISIQSAAPPALSFSLGLDTVIQRKESCACGGGCPRCQNPTTIRPNLSISNPGDAAELEADHVASRVARGETAQINQASPPVARHGDGAAEINADFLASLQSSKGRGDSLDGETRSEMESRIGHDFGQVRVHKNGEAQSMSESIGASAFTHGPDIYFNQGTYAPNSSEGKVLLAHELTHTVQQRNGAGVINRALKVEIQTRNFVWMVDNIGRRPVARYKPRAKPLPRKYSPSGRSEERGDRPAYLSVGEKGGPAKKKGSTEFVEVQGSLTTEPDDNADSTKEAQFVRVYKFKTPVTIAEIEGKEIEAGQLSLVDETDNSDDPAMTNRFNPNTFEFKYLNADDTELDIHLNRSRKVDTGRVKFMRVGRRGRPDIDRTKRAQFIETWKITRDPAAGKVDFFGEKVNVDLIRTVDNAEDSDMEGKFNPKTWEKRYFLSDQFMAGDILMPFSVKQDVHRDTDGRFQPGHIRLMEKQKVLEPEEQTAIEVQSENHGVLEFETPKWFRNTTELLERVQEAKDITDAINTSREITATPPDTADAKIFESIKERIGAPGVAGTLIGEKVRTPTETMGRIFEWPQNLSTAHLRKLGNRRLLVEVRNFNWPARIQVSEGVALSDFGKLVEEHAETTFGTLVTSSATNIFNRAFADAQAADPSLNEALFANLKGFLTLVVSYIVSGQTRDRTGLISKGAFRLLARTNFGSMYTSLLSPAEKALFKKMLGDPRQADDNPILEELEALINAVRSITEDARKLAMHPRPANVMLDPVTLTRSSTFFFRKAGTSGETATFGPTIFSWLTNMTRGRDLLVGSGISDAMGARKVETRPDRKDFKLALFEVRNTQSHSGADHIATGWVPFVTHMIEGAKERSADTPDDPATPKVDESSRTGLVD
jgi:hypothetical protein